MSEPPARSKRGVRGAGTLRESLRDDDPVMPLRSAPHARRPVRGGQLL